MIAQTIKLPPVFRGDTWKGFRVTSILIDGEAPATALASALIHFRESPDASGEPAHVLSTADAAELVIDDAAAYTLRAPAQSLPLAAGKWYFDVQFTDAAGAVNTYLVGTLTILQDTTRT